MDGTIISSTTSAPRPSTLRHPSPNLSSSSRSSSSSSAMSEQYSSAASNGSMAAHIVPFPSLAHSLSSLQYATSMQNVPIHHQAKGRSAESEEKVCVVVFHLLRVTDSTC